MGEESKDEECYALLLEPLWEPIEGLNLPSLQRIYDEEAAERLASAVDTPPPSPGRGPVAFSIMQVTNDIFKTKKRPEFDYPLWQVREAATEWLGPFGNVASFEHGLTFEDTEGYKQAQLDLEVVSAKIKRQKKGAQQSKRRVVAAEAKEAEEETKREQAASKGEDIINETPDFSTIVGPREIDSDISIVKEFDILVARAKKLKAAMALSKSKKHDDVCVILKIIYTKEEIRREKKEGFDVRVGEIEVIKEVEEWLETKHGIKAMLNRVKEVKKFYKVQLKLVRTEIKELIAGRPKLVKDLQAMKKRKKAFDRGKKLDFHRFETVDEAIEAMRMVEQPIADMLEKEESLREIEESRLALTLKEKKKENKKLIEAEQHAALIERYGNKEKKRIIEEARVDAREKQIRRPWDGPAGRAFRLWKEKAENLLEALLNPPSDTPSSSSTDVSTDSEPEKDETSAASIERHKKWKKIHDEKLIANRYRWGRLLTDDQIAKQIRKAEERRLAIFKYSKPTEAEEKTADEKDLELAGEDGDDENDDDDDDDDDDDENDVDVDEMNDNEDGEGKTKEQESGVVDANENKEGQDGENKEA